MPRKKLTPAEEEELRRTIEEMSPDIKHPWLQNLVVLLVIAVAIYVGVRIF